MLLSSQISIVLLCVSVCHGSFASLFCGCMWRKHVGDLPAERLLHTNQQHRYACGVRYILRVVASSASRDAFALRLFCFYFWRISLLSTMYLATCGRGWCTAHGGGWLHRWHGFSLTIAIILLAAAKRDGTVGSGKHGTHGTQWAFLLYLFRRFFFTNCVRRNTLRKRPRKGKPFVQLSRQWLSISVRCVQCTGGIYSYRIGPRAGHCSVLRAGVATTNIVSTLPHAALFILFIIWLAENIPFRRGLLPFPPLRNVHQLLYIWLEWNHIAACYGCTHFVKPKTTNTK